MVRDKGEIIELVHSYLNHSITYHLPLISFFRVKQITGKINKLTDLTRAGAVTERYLDECYGDAVYTLAISQSFQSMVAKKKIESDNKIVKDMPISSKRVVVKEFTLAHNDKAFKEFRDTMEDEVRKAVISVYGRFSKFTVPILSFTQVHQLSQLFKTKLRRYHELISVLLHKYKGSGYKKHLHKHVQWDNFILFVFCMLQQIHNKDNFSLAEL